MRVAALAIAVLAACSFRSGVVPPDGGAGTGGDDAHASFDASNLASCTTPGQRVCVDATHSGTCDGSLQPVIDRNCPTGSMCGGGYCQPPVGAKACTRDMDCMPGKPCDLYVVGGNLGGFCTQKVGNGGPYHACTTAGDDATCASGMCASNGEKTQCLVPCANQDDSTCPMDKHCDPLVAPATVEGIATSAQSACFD